MILYSSMIGPKVTYAQERENSKKKYVWDSIFDALKVSLASITVHPYQTPYSLNQTEITNEVCPCVNFLAIMASLITPVSQ